MKKAISILLAILVFAIGTSAVAHSGRTDSNGGHKDNKNVSGLGSYHYHCGGYPAHLHPNGVCPYSSKTSISTSFSSSTKKTTTVPTASPSIAYTIPSVKNEQGETARIKKLGTAYSVIEQGISTTTVRTDSLVFSEDTRPIFGVIYAPSTGQASLRQTASNSANTITQCSAGAIVYVVSKDDDFSLVVYQNNIGYVRNTALEFYNIVEQDVKLAFLSVDEKIDGSAIINIRLAPDGRVIGKYQIGTEIVVIEQGDDWCEIEVDGLHGYVMSKFITFLP